MIKIENGFVIIPYPDMEGEYSFALRRAGEKFMKSNYSDWILHLAGKTWVTMPILEKLAEILKKEAPEIDWDGSLRQIPRFR